MQFSLAKLFLVLLFIGLLLGATFSLPQSIGLIMLVFISSFVLPAFVIVGVIQTRGIRQAFFLGALFTGIPHTVFNTYLVVSYAMGSGASGKFDSLAEFADDSRAVHIVQLLAILLGCFGGLSGMAAYCFFRMGTKAKLPLSEPGDQ